MALYVKELVDMYEKRRKEHGTYPLPGEAPFCGNYIQCRCSDRGNCVKCSMFETYRDELNRRD